MNEAKNCEVGFRQILAKGATIYSANTDLPWPGRAAVVVHQVHFVNAKWAGERLLNGVGVSLISSDLTIKEQTVPEKLPRNQRRMFQGAILAGEGFKVDEARAQSLMSSDITYRDVVFPYLVGDDITSDPHSKPKCWAICFWDWPEHQARQYPEAIKIVEGEVYAERQCRKTNGSYKYSGSLPQTWWQYGRWRPELYKALAKRGNVSGHPPNDTRTISRLLAVSTASTKYPAFRWLPTSAIFSNTLCVLADERDEMFALLSSDVHAVWAWKRKTSKQADMQSMRYAHGLIFETFPFPDGFLRDGDSGLGSLGRNFFEARQAHMERLGYGLTGFYNEFHQPSEQRPEVVQLRNAQSEINYAVGKLYGWNDIDLRCGFHEVGYLPKGANTRFTMSETTRVEVLSRLGELNGVQRKADEAAGLAEAAEDEDEATNESETSSDLFAGSNVALSGGRK